MAINPIADSGFKTAGDSPARIPTDTAFTFATGAYPNQRANVAIKGNFAGLPNTWASPYGPVRLNVNTQARWSVLNRRASPTASDLARPGIESGRS